jgi:DNA-binding NtrC family response regulator
MAGEERKVLLVDSEPTLTLALSDALADADLSHRPLLARTADQAAALLRAHPTIGLVILDLGLPGANAHALARAIIEDFPQAALILMATILCPEVRAEFGGRVLGYLQKPFDLEEFVQLSCKGLNAP